jgi:hypothetical protein
MLDKKSLSKSQLVFVEQSRVAVDLTEKQLFALYKKSRNSSIPFSILEEVYKRGVETYNHIMKEDYPNHDVLNTTPDQYAFNRVNSFIANGQAAILDKDLLEKRGLWDNIHAKRERIKRGSGEKMRKPGQKGAPTPEAIKQAQEEYTGAEKVSKDPNKPASRFQGTTQLTKTYKNQTPGYQKESMTRIIKRVVREQTVSELSVPLGTTGKRKQWNPPMVGIRMASGKIEKHPPGKSSSSGGGNGGGGDGGA